MKLISSDNKFMALALKFAKKGGRDVAPNPMVGAVIVKNGKIIGKGWHKKFGGPHAEVNAVDSVKNKSDLKGSTIYVTLEPCRHYGKTPPCSELIKKVGISRVVCGSHDPFQQKIESPKGQKSKGPKVQRAKSPTIVFLKGNIADECKELNKFFFTWVTKKRPFVTVKVAVSADGFVAGPLGQPVRITDSRQDKEVHKMRAAHQAIMVGINTVLNDDPQLNVRLVKGRDPLRVILDSDFRIPLDSRVLRDDNYLIAVTQDSRFKIQDSRFIKNIWVSPTRGRVSLKKLLKHLAEMGISSVLAETGPTLFKSIIKEGLCDELIVFNGKKNLREGIRLK